MGQKEIATHGLIISSKATLYPSDDQLFLPQLAGRFDWVFGLDEVGVACLAGPVVAGCYAYPLTEAWTSKVWSPKELRIHDSKKLSEKVRLASGHWLTSQEGAVSSIGEAQVSEIDKINIYHASGLAMTRALESALSVVKDLSPEGFRALVLIDGNHVPEGVQKLEGAHLRARSIIKGDAQSFAVASAAILAKNHRDQFMKSLAREFEVYGWDSNVGYPTEKHRMALRMHGPTNWHRRSFNLEF